MFYDLSEFRKGFDELFSERVPRAAEQLSLIPIVGADECAAESSVLLQLDLEVYVLILLYEIAYDNHSCGLEHFAGLFLGAVCQKCLVDTLIPLVKEIVYRYNESCAIFGR